LEGVSTGANRKKVPIGKEASLPVTVITVDDEPRKKHKKTRNNKRRKDQTDTVGALTRSERSVKFFMT